MSLSEIGSMADSLGEVVKASRATSVRQLPEGGPQLSQRTALNMPGIGGKNAALAGSERMRGNDYAFESIRQYAFHNNETKLQGSHASYPTQLATPGRSSLGGGIGQVSGLTKLYDPPHTDAGGTLGSAGKSESGMEAGSESLHDVLKELITAIRENTEAIGGRGSNMGGKAGAAKNGKQSGQDMEGLASIAVSQFYNHLK